MRDEFLEKPYAGPGGIVGEFMVGPTEPMPQQLLPPLAFPEPDWDQEKLEREEQQRVAEEEKAQKLLADKAKREEEQQ